MLWGGTPTQVGATGSYSDGAPAPV